MRSGTTLLAVFAAGSLFAPALAGYSDKDSLLPRGDGHPAPFNPPPNPKNLTSSSSTPPSPTPYKAKDAKVQPPPKGGPAADEAHNQHKWQHLLKELSEEEKHIEHKFDVLTEAVMQIYPSIIKMEDHLAWLEIGMERQHHRLAQVEHELHTLKAHDNHGHKAAEGSSKDGLPPSAEPSVESHQTNSTTPSSAPTKTSDEASAPPGAEPVPGIPSNATTSDTAPNKSPQSPTKDVKEQVAPKGSEELGITSTSSEETPSPTPAPKLTKRRQRGYRRRSLEELD